MMEVKFYEVSQVEDASLFAAVIVSRYRGKWIFCKHKERDTWEIPGGHREANESILDTAKRELYEETGATAFEIQPIYAYSFAKYAMLFFAEITELGELPLSEIEKIECFSEIPHNLTYPSIHLPLFEKVKEVLSL